MAPRGAGGRDCALSPRLQRPMHVELARLTSHAVLHLRDSMRRVTTLHASLHAAERPALGVTAPAASPPPVECAAACGPSWQDTAIDVRQVAGVGR